MLWMPVPALTPVASPVAVSDAAAGALECALLEHDAEAAASHLRSALLLDPWFCVWLSGWSGAEKDTIDQLATWFASDLVAHLALCQPTPLAWTRPSEVQETSFAARAAGILCAALAHVDASDEIVHSAAFLCAVLQSREQPPDAAPSQAYLVTRPGIEWRLPRLIARVSGPEATDSDFDARLEQAKLEAMKELAYGASHEVNNPLANISGRAQALLRDETDPKKRRLLAAIDAQALRAHEMISDLMLFARPPALEKSPSDIGKLAGEVVDELSAVASERQVRLQVVAPVESMVADVDPTQTMVALNALVRNGIEAVGSHGQVVVTLACEGSQVAIRVADTGPGLSPDDCQHMFDPFYSGREAGRGLGFGLSKCWRIATEHGGSVQVEQTSNAGTTMVLRLPIGPGER